MQDVGRLVSPSSARFSERFSRPLLDETMKRGDPVADRPIAVLAAGVRAKLGSMAVAASGTPAPDAA